MNPLTLVGIVLIVFLGSTAWMFQRMAKPKHMLWAWDSNFNTIQPKILTKLSGTTKIKRADGSIVPFNMVAEYGIHRQDGKGQFWLGDMTTGQLLRPKKDGSFEGTNGIHNELALSDGRIDTLVRATGGDTLTLKHIAIGLGIVGLLVCVVIWQFSRGGV